MDTISIIIVNYKSELKTIDYIQNELVKINIPYTTVIVNLSSTEKSNSLLIKTLNAKHISSTFDGYEPCNCYVISHTDNLGFAKGNNLGALFVNKYIHSKYVLFSNNDIRIIDYDILEQLRNKMEKLQTIGMIGPNCLNIRGESESPRPYYPYSVLYIYRYWLIPFMTKHMRAKFLKHDYPKQAKEGFHYKISGSFFMVRMSDFVKCGMMDANTFLYYEEDILNERMKAIDKGAYYYPASRVIHEHSQTIGKFYNLKNKLKIELESASYYYRTYKNVDKFTITIGKLTSFLFFNLKTLFNR